MRPPFDPILRAAVAAFVEKNGTTGFTARAFTVSPVPKDINEVRAVIPSVPATPGA